MARMLTVAAIVRAKPREKPFRLADYHGLYLIVRPDGTRYWRVDYRYRGRRGTLSVGVYDETSLAEAREQRDEIRKLLRADIDPAHHRKTERRRKQLAHAQTFEGMATTWLERQAKIFAPATMTRVRYLVHRYAIRGLGTRPIASVTAADVLAVLQPIEARGRHETAHRTRQIIGQICRYAVATGQAERDPTADLRGALLPVPTEHYASITTPADIGALLRAIDGLEASVAVLMALKISPYVFVRPGELRKAEWAEVDLEEALWRLPADRMKMRRDHLVPLAPQVVTLFRTLHGYTGTGRYCFPSLRSAKRTISNMALNAALRRLGYGHDEMTAHGFRSMASTRLNEMGWHPDLIELQLAHQERSQSRAAYNRAQRLEERTAMMRAWADELDRLRDLR